MPGTGEKYFRAADRVFPGCSGFSFTQVNVNITPVNSNLGCS